MKRILAMLLACVMLLALCACDSSGTSGEPGNAGGAYEDEVFMLFDKYDDIIYALENGEYTYAIQQIVQMSNQGREDLTSMDQIFQAEWYPEKDIDRDVPAKITVSEGGAVEIDGKAYTFLLEYSSSEQLGGWLMEDGTCRYRVSVNFEDGWTAPYLTLHTARETPDGYRSEDWLATYYNDAMLPWLLVSWSRFGEDESMPYHFYLDYDNIQLNDANLKWTVTASEGQNLTIDIDNGAYTAALELRGEQPLLTLTETATGNSACYYNSSLGYDKSWPEYIYIEAMEYLDDCLEEAAEGWTPTFNDYTVEIPEGESRPYYEGNAAWKRLHELFTALGDYKDSAEIAGRFTILKDMYTGASMLSVDNMGNESSNSTYEVMKYNALGQLVQGESWDISWMYGGYWSNTKYFTYDETGRISQIQQGSGNNVQWIVIPTYDSEGRMVGGTYKSNSYTHELSYTYDAQGRLIENIVWNDNYRYKHNYTYDASGKLVKDVYWYGYDETKDYKYNRYTVDYTYDASGYLTQRVITREYYSSWNDQFSVEETIAWVYTNDAQGRPVSAEYTNLDSKGESQYASRTITYHYDDLYFFD